MAACPAAPGDLMRARRFNLHVEQVCRAQHNFIKISGAIIIQPLAHAEPRESNGALSKPLRVVAR